MARKRKSFWWETIRRKLFRSSHRHQDSNMHENFSQELDGSSHEETAGSDFVSKEDIAAVVIQASFRGHLARRAYRALRSLVKLQALVRGVIVRRQARIALDCMHALARLQITVRARQLLLNN